jgi:hypothetical protein
MGAKATERVTSGERRPRPGAPAPRPPRDLEIGMALAAQLSGVSRNTLRAAAQTGQLPARRISPGPRGQWVLTLAAIDGWLKAARHRPGPLPQRRPPEAPASAAPAPAPAESAA